MTLSLPLLRAAARTRGHAPSADHAPVSPAIDADAITARVRLARFEAVGDRCVLIRLGDAVDLATNQSVHAVAALLDDRALPGVTEIAPSFTTLAVHFQPSAWRGPTGASTGTPTERLIDHLQTVLQGPLPALQWRGRQIEIPACYGGECGPDLDEVAAHAGLSADDVIQIHSGQPLTLYTFFFAPGNPFAGPVDPRLQIGRRRTPRTRVEAGSVGLANGLSSIYSVASPGGWNIIARTPWAMFDLQHNPPTRLRLGDQLQFKPISPEEFHSLQERRS